MGRELHSRKEPVPDRETGRASLAEGRESAKAPIRDRAWWVMSKGTISCGLAKGRTLTQGWGLWGCRGPGRVGFTCDSSLWGKKPLADDFK